MAHLQVTCITKRPSHYDPHERIQALGGGGWYKAEETVIGEIERRTNSYFVRVGGRSVSVIVATHLGRKYLKTEADGYSPDNLLNLRDCQR
ncbi:MAG TPA: DUF3892 domain-containing protein [Gaiellaceae bacterium]|nr:DUF3892 domain-containing protein [Gaiellaceae bacterium]